MGRFNAVYNYRDELKKMLFQNTKLLNLLYYNQKNPLDQKRISNPYSLVNNNIFFKPKNYSTLTDVKSMLFINFKFAGKGDYSVLGDVTIICDVIVHNDLIEIEVTGEDESRDRMFDILEHIDNFLSGKPIGIGKATPYTADPLYANDNFQGYRVTYKLLGLNMNLNNKT